MRFTTSPKLQLPIILADCHEDRRGYSMKTYEMEAFRAGGISCNFNEVFESFSLQGVLRGLHFQKRHPQGKLVRAVAGRVFDVAVDLRPGSATFGVWDGVLLDSAARNALFVPKGFAHGFYVLSESALVHYLISGPYVLEDDTGVRWDDPDIAVRWPLKGKPVLSERDAALPGLRDFL